MYPGSRLISSSLSASRSTKSLNSSTSALVGAYLSGACTLAFRISRNLLNRSMSPRVSFPRLAKHGTSNGRNNSAAGANHLGGHGGLSGSRKDEIEEHGVRVGRCERNIERPRLERGVRKVLL